MLDLSFFRWSPLFHSESMKSITPFHCANKSDETIGSSTIGNPPGKCPPSCDPLSPATTRYEGALRGSSYLSNRPIHPFPTPSWYPPPLSRCRTWMNEFPWRMTGTDSKTCRALSNGWKDFGREGEQSTLGGLPGISCTLVQVRLMGARILFASTLSHSDHW